MVLKRLYCQSTMTLFSPSTVEKCLSLCSWTSCSAAFDAVDHHILLSVLASRFSIASTALSWFKSYLSDRTQLFNYAGGCHPAIQLTAVFHFHKAPFWVHATSYHIRRTLLICWNDILYSHTCTPTIAADSSTPTYCVSACRPVHADINSSCKSRRLQLNASKTVAICFGSKSNLSQLNKRDCTVKVKVCSSIIQLAAVVRDLGLHLDSELSMKQHVNKVAAICYYHLRRLRQIRRRVGSEVTIRLVLALIMSRIDYCNSALASLPHSTTILHTAASAERSSSTGVRTWTEGTCYSKPSPTPLATSPLASPV